MKRLLTAALLIPIAWYLCKRAPFWLFLLAMAVVISVAVWEAFGLTAMRGARPFRVVGLVACWALAWSFSGSTPRLDPIDPLAALLMVVPLAAMLLRPDPAAMLEAIQATLLPVVTVGLGLAYSVALRAIPGENGSDLMVLGLLCVTLSDTGAYYVGSALGKRRLAPSISPKKSWEGAAGGWVGAMIGAALAHFWFFQRLTVVHAVVIGTLMCAAGIVGDLTESLLKRTAGAKDSSGLLPGHGGLLDRVDSLIIAAPVLYYYWRALLEGTI